MSRFQFVEENLGVYGVKRLCRILGVSRSGFNRWQAAAPSRLERERADRELGEAIRAIHAESDGTYGRPRIAATLRNAGQLVNHKRVGRLMRGLEIAGVHLRKKVRTTVSEPSATAVPDLLGRNFTAVAPNTRYVGDITYLPAGEGRFLYL